MRSSLSKNLFLFYSSSFSSCSYCYSSSPARALLLRLRVCHFSSSSNFLSLPHSPHYSRRSEEQSKNVRVSVWWDFDSCHLPAGVNVSRIAPVIMEALRANGIKGPIQINAFGDVLQLSKVNQEILPCTGIHLFHVPNVGRISASQSVLVDLMIWVSQNPPPAHIFLISGDRDSAHFAQALNRLRMHNYNILFASYGNASDVLCSAATIMWQWPSLLKGEDLIGKRINHPPDGSYGSWYGNYKIPLENPFSASESVKNVEIGEPTQDSPTPNLKSVARHIRRILSSHPKGLPISTLRSELAKCNVHLDKSLFGYKKLSQFLLSVPHVQLKHSGDGNFCVCLIPQESSRHLVSNDRPSMTSVNNDERGHVTALKLNGNGSTEASESDATPSTVSLHERSSDEKVEDVADAQLSETQVLPEVDEVSKSKVDFTKMSPERLPDNEIVGPEDVSPNISGNYTTSENHSHSSGNDYMQIKNDHLENDESEQFIAEEKYERTAKKDADEVCHGSSSLPVDDSLVGERPGESTETYSKSSNFFGWIRSWWPSWRSSAKSDDLTAHQTKEVSHSEEPKLSELDQTISQAEEAKLSDEEVKLSQHSVEPKSQLDQTVDHCVEPKSSEVAQNVLHPEKPELFFRDSFWNDMESFVCTPKGSLLFSLSTSRENLAQNLQKSGPLVLRSLTVKDNLQLVDLLLADKKWLEESPSQVYPFKVTLPAMKSSLAGLSHGANGLRSLFLSKTSKSSSQKSSEQQDVDKHNQNTPHTRVPTPETKYDKGSKSDILADCRKLVNEILREHPDGYNIGCFRKQFAKRYGYELEVQKLGYKKLANLLQTMPEASIKSSHIFPSVSVCDFNQETSILKNQVADASHVVSISDSELSDSASASVDDDNDSPWEELGPVSANNSNQIDLDSVLSREDKELNTSNYPDYEPIGSDYDSSESEGDNFSVTKSEEDGKSKFDEQDSSFWQALDLWDGSKVGENSVKKSENGDALGNSMADILNSSLEQTRVALSKVPSGNYREKQRSQKTYSFVADSRLPPKDKPIDANKKENKSKMQN